MNFNIGTEFKSSLFHALNANLKLYHFFSAVFLICEQRSSVWLLFSDPAESMSLSKSPLENKQTNKQTTKTPKPKPTNKTTPRFI